MTRTEAVARILRDIGFRPAGSSLDDQIVSCLQEAQDDLERGKTLPPFLLVEDQTLALASGTHTVAIPTGFIRESDETRIRFFPPNSSVPVFLERKLYIDAVMANLHASTDSDATVEPVAPAVYVLRKSTIDFITTADQNYTLYWDYYKEADVLSSGSTENAWLADKSGRMWLVGEAGLRIASSLRDVNALAVFQKLRDAGRAATFGEQIAAETASGPFRMGANL
jgi:hypothetical protein